MVEVGLDLIYPCGIVYLMGVARFVDWIVVVVVAVAVVETEVVVPTTAVGLR